MELSLLIKGLIIGIAVSIPLGPIGVLCVQRTINKGWYSGFVSGLGAATSDTIYAVVAGFSLSYIINFLEMYEFYFQILGALVLMIMGYHIFRSCPVSDLKKYKSKGRSSWQDYLITLVITISNPLAIFVFLAVFAGSGVVMGLDNIFHSGLIVVGVALGASLWWFLLTGLVNIFRHKFNLRRLWWTNKIAGSLIMALAVGSIIYFNFLKQ